MKDKRISLKVWMSVKNCTSIIITNTIIIGYGIVGGLSILTILRSIIFCVLDARGFRNGKIEN